MLSAGLFAHIPFLAASRQTSTSTSQLGRGLAFHPRSPGPMDVASKPPGVLPGPQKSAPVEMPSYTHTPTTQACPPTHQPGPCDLCTSGRGHEMGLGRQNHLQRLRINRCGQCSGTPIKEQNGTLGGGRGSSRSLRSLVKSIAMQHTEADPSHPWFIRKLA